MLNALTIDVEDYFQVSAFESVIHYEMWDRYESRVEQNTYHILDLLDEYQTQATFFVLGWIAERHPKLVRIIHERGHEVASHGYSHRRIYTQSIHQFCEETRRSKGILEDTTGQAIKGYRAASYSITKKSLWALDILTEEGFRYDSSIFPIRHDLYGISDSRRFSHMIHGREHGTILECPLSTVRIAGINFPVAGGGYLRMFPYRFTHWAIRHLNQKERQPAIVYFHPWEIDPSQPRIRTNWKSRFRHYTKLNQMEVKLRKLLSSFSFGPMVQAFQSFLVSHVI
jgi:polysaccharide deacetylase family protein (PEP-CTERM system associated)